MAKTVSFGMYWQSYGCQSVTLPDYVDENDKDEIVDYLKWIWDDIPLPVGNYVIGSDELDEESLNVY